MVSDTTTVSRLSSSTTQESSKTVDTQTFELFSKLPEELRREIWTYSIPDPRVITIDTGTNHTEHSPGRYPFFSKNACFPDCSHIGMLSACHESRAVAKKVYSFKHCLHPRYIIPIDTSRDIVLMDLDTLKAFLKPRFWKYGNENLETIKLKTLAIGPLSKRIYHDVTDSYDSYFSSLLHLLSIALRAFETIEAIVFCWKGDEDLETVARVISRFKMWKEGVEETPGYRFKSGSWKGLRVPRIASLNGEDMNAIREKLVLRMLGSEILA